MKRRDLESHLRAHGCELLRNEKAHDIWYNPNTLADSPIPRHREVKYGTAKAICRQLSVPPPPNR